jgi:hypothetical protein
VGHLVQTQVLGPPDYPVNPLFSKRLNSQAIFEATVVNSVVVKSSNFNAVQQLV